MAYGEWGLEKNKYIRIVGKILISRAGAQLLYIWDRSEITNERGEQNLSDQSAVFTLTRLVVSEIEWWYCACFVTLNEDIWLVRAAVILASNWLSESVNLWSM